MKKIFLLAGAIWLALNLATLTAYPAVWVDEILSADAGIHLAQGKGFVSAGWFNQPSWEFWASYPPLYSFVLAGWLRVFGLSAFAVRSFGLTLVTASLAMLWLFLKRLGDEASSWIIVAAVAVCEPLAFLERAGRPDSVSVFLLSATALVWAEKEWRWRSVLLFMLGSLAVPAALQYAAFVVLLATLLQIWFRPFTRRETTVWASGAAFGAAALAAIYAWHHVLRIFIESTVASKHSSAGRLLQNLFLKNGQTPFVFSDIISAPLRDYAAPIAIVSGIIIWFLAKDHTQVRRLSSFGVTCAIAIPLAVQLLGKYPIYYAYMGTAPAVIAVLAGCSRLSGKARIGSAVILALLITGGAGRFWWKGYQQGAQPIYDRTQLASSTDTVVADYPAYYELLGHVRELFAVGYAGGKVMPHFPSEQAQRVTKLVVRQSMFPEVAKKVGGRWQRSGDVLMVRRGQISRFAVVDDDTRHGYEEPMGIYVRMPD